MQGKNYKNAWSVEMCFSSNNLLPTEKTIKSHRYIKSQEATQRHESLYTNCTLIKQMCYDKMTAELWDSRMQKLLRKLKTPEGERDITKKMYRFFNTKSKIPSLFDDELLKILVGLKVKKLKKTKGMFLKQGRKKKHSTVKIEIPYTSKENISKKSCLLPRINSEKKFGKYAQIKSKIPTKMKDYVNDMEIDPNAYFKQQLLELVKKWTFKHSIHMLLDVDTLDGTLIDFTDDIINAIKDVSVLTETDVQCLQNIINKWLNKLRGENTLLTKEISSDLIIEIQNFIFSITQFNDSRSSSKESNDDYYSATNKLDFEQLSTDNWLYQTPNCVTEQCFNHSCTEHIKNLEKGFQENTHGKEINENKVYEWNTTNHFEWDDFDHEKIKFSSMNTRVDIKYLKQNILTKKYENIISSWIDSCIVDGKLQMLCLRNQFEFIHDLAVKLVRIKDDAVKKSKIEYTKIIERIVSEQFLQNDIHVCLKHKIKLITAIQSTCFDSSSSEHMLYKYYLNMTIKNWLKTSLLYIHATASETKRLEKITQNFAQSLYHCTNNETIYSKILQYICMLYERNRIDDHIKQHAINLKEFLEKLNLFTNKNVAEVRTLNGDGDMNMQAKLLNSTVTVYGFTMSHHGKKKNTTHISDDQFQITSSQINECIEIYAKLLIKEINEWIDALNISQINDIGLRKVAVTNLAEDIINRQKYLKLHPESKGTEKSEEENLKYQIFKWINKLIGEEHVETIQQASKLMERIENIPLSLLNNGNDDNMKENHNHPQKTESKNDNNQMVINSNTREFDKNDDAQYLKIQSRKMESLGNSKNIIDINVNTKYDNDSVFKIRSSQHNKWDKPVTSSIYQDIQGRNQNTFPKKLDDFQGIAEGMTLQELYDCNGQILNQKLLELPLQISTVEQEQLAKLARKGMYNGIWKTYFTLKVDPEVVKDYAVFELFFDKRIEDMLDCLPQTKEMVNMRHEWKKNVLKYIIKMLQYEQTIIGTPSFRQQILTKFDSKMFRDFKGSTKILHFHVSNIADAYILYTRYKDSDSLKSKIYKWQFMKKMKELAEIIKDHDINFINSAQFYKLAFDILQSVPIPSKKDLIEVADEILIEQEIEEWYKALHTIPVDNDNETILRKRKREILAKRLYHVEKQILAYGDPSLELEKKLKDTILQYLEKEVILQQVDNFKINYMAEELINRIKRKRQQTTLDYEIFRKDNPASSTFIETDIAYLLSLGNIESNNKIENNLCNDQALQCNFTNNNNVNNVDNVLESHKVAGPSHRRANSSKLGSVFHGQESCFQEIYSNNEKTNERFPPKIPKIKIFGPGINSSGKLESEITQHKTDIPMAYAQKQDLRERGKGLPASHGSQTQTTEYAEPSRSTARIGTNTCITGTFRNDQVVNEDLCDEPVEVKHKCHCIERMQKLRRLRYCEEMHPYPFPCHAMRWPGFFFW